MTTKETLIIGYGNVDRQDDGIAWHTLVACANQLGFSGPFVFEEGFPEEMEGPVDFMYNLQLLPEMAEAVAKYPKVVFVDAHTGAVPEEVHVETVFSAFQSSPLTHHFTPQSCLSLAETIYEGRTNAILVSIRGYEFEFTHQLSNRTASLIEPALEKIMEFVSPN